MKFIFCVVFLLLSIVRVYPQECVTYDFEEDFDVLFDNSRSVCTGQEEWTIGYYSDTDMEPPHNNSYVFISPSENLSCITSFPFNLSSEGSLEIYVLMESASLNDIVSVLVQNESDGNVLGQGQLVSTDGNLTSTGGVQAVNINWIFTGTQEAYIVLIGSASEDSTVLVDSFRYIPPDTDTDSCQVYDENEVTETPEGTTENTSEEATTDPIYTGTTETEPEEATTEPVYTGTTETGPDEATTELTYTETTGAESEEETTEPTYTGTTETEEENTETTYAGTTETGTEDETTQPTLTGTTETESEQETTEPTYIETTETAPEQEITEPTYTGSTGTEEETTEPWFTEPTEIELVQETTEPTYTGTTDLETEVTEPNFTGTTDLDTEESTNGEDSTTLIPPTPEEVIQSPETSFWNALTISVVTILCLIVLSLICWYFFECGRRKSMNNTPPLVVYEDFENLPRTFTVPRINRVFSDSIYSKDKYFV